MDRLQILSTFQSFTVKNTLSNMNNITQNTLSIIHISGLVHAV